MHLTQEDKTTPVQLSVAATAHKAMACKEVMVLRLSTERICQATRHQPGTLDSFYGQAGVTGSRSAGQRRARDVGNTAAGLQGGCMDMLESEAIYVWYLATASSVLWQWAGSLFHGRGA